MARIRRKNMRRKNGEEGVCEYRGRKNDCCKAKKKMVR